MKKVIILFLSLCLFASLFANDELSKHRLSLDLGGPGAIVTFEYQYQFYSRDMHSLSFTAGTGMAGLAFSFPVGLNYTFGEKNQIMTGVHFVPLLIYNFFGWFMPAGLDFNWMTVYCVAPRIGYRRVIQGRKESFYLQVYFSPLIEFESSTILPWAGLGFGVYL